MHPETLKQYKEKNIEYEESPKDVYVNGFIFMRNYFIDSAWREIKTVYRLKDANTGEEYLGYYYVDYYKDNNGKVTGCTFTEGVYEKIDTETLKDDIGRITGYTISARYNQYFIPFNQKEFDKIFHPEIEITKDDGKTTFKKKIPVKNTDNISYVISTTNKNLGIITGKRRYSVSREDFLNPTKFDELWGEQRKKDIEMAKIKQPLGKADQALVHRNIESPINSIAE